MINRFLKDKGELIPVKLAPLIAGNVPVRLAAGRFVILEPLIAAAVPVNLSAGIVPVTVRLPSTCKLFSQVTFLELSKVILSRVPPVWRTVSTINLLMI